MGGPASVTAHGRDEQVDLPMDDVKPILRPRHGQAARK